MKVNILMVNGMEKEKNMRIMVYYHLKEYFLKVKDGLVMEKNFII